MKKLFEKLIPTVKHTEKDLDLYNITHRFKSVNPVLVRLEELYFMGDFEGYAAEAAKFSIYERAEALEYMYSRPSLLKISNFPKIVLNPFTAGVSPPDLKYLNVRLSCPYMKWILAMRNTHEKQLKPEWDSFFNRYAAYYITMHDKSPTDFLVSLMFSRPALEYSKELRDTAKGMMQQIGRNGVPPDLDVRSDAFRAVLRKSRYMLESVGDLGPYMVMVKAFFKDMEGIDPGKLSVAVLELLFITVTSRKLPIDINLLDNITQNTFDAVKAEINRNPGYISELFRIMGFRDDYLRQNGYLVRKLLDLVKSPTTLTDSALSGYLHVVRLVNPCDKFYTPELIADLRRRIRDREGFQILYRPVNMLATSNMLPNKIRLELRSAIYDNMSMHLRGENKLSGDFLSEIRDIMNVVEYMSERRINSPDIVKYVLDRSKLLKRDAYKVALFKIVFYYTEMGRYDDNYFWSDFVDYIDKAKSMDLFLPVEVCIMYRAYFFFKMEQGIDLESLFGPQRFKEMLEVVRKALISCHSRGLPAFQGELKIRGIDSVLYSPDYWFLDLAVPDAKVGFTSGNNKWTYSYQSLSRALKRVGWEIVKLPCRASKIDLTKEIIDLLNSRRGKLAHIRMAEPAPKAESLATRSRNRINK